VAPPGSKGSSQARLESDSSLLGSCTTLSKKEGVKEEQRREKRPEKRREKRSQELGVQTGR